MIRSACDFTCSLRSIPFAFATFLVLPSTGFAQGLETAEDSVGAVTDIVEGLGGPVFLLALGVAFLVWMFSAMSRQPAPWSIMVGILIGGFGLGHLTEINTGLNSVTGLGGS